MAAAAEEGPYLRSLVIVANVIGFVYNIPQVVLTVRTKSANDISAVSLAMRLVSSALWIIYTSIIWSPDVFISWMITGVSSTILVYYKVKYSKTPICDEFVFWKRGGKDRLELKDEPAPATASNTAAAEPQQEHPNP